ncbi:methyltransferase domain-containing protein [bacterium]|jgi:malonyl-ACP O-methyltransferase BioC|nr:methyltransferase domain-containing protein [bacterium]
MQSTRLNRFDNRVSTYDAVTGQQRDIEKILLSRLIPPTGRILELGCGTGKGTLTIHDWAPQASIIAVDKASEMIQFASTEHGSPAITYSEMDIDQALPEGEFDLIIANATLQWVSGLDDLFKRCARQLTETGRLAFTTYGPQTYIELQSIWKVFYPDTAFQSEQFPSPQALQISLDQCFHEVELSQTIITKVSPSLKALLTTIHLSGTNNPQPSIKGLWTPKQFKQIEAKYKERYGEIRSTSQICYGVASCPR